ncbi:hypothetical protein CryarDRAFT_1202 [Cryptosporangium arvum DSM 44712]|uniref:Uncharacterized protein n=1 Tax=Cryptosporangium arvum DSM 44712 TaxID=927661 RepID=A0A010ZSD8_9ACTN|nr:hypothetical protein CryarDRAFT_1202 [Cryptosporangium arvum DSM 44712]
MGGLKPWHVLASLCCLLILGGGVAGLIAAVTYSSRRKR